MQPVSIGEETIGLMSAINSLNTTLSNFLTYMQTTFFKWFFVYLFVALVFTVVLAFYMYSMYKIISRGGL
jgi:hypothetical protein